MKTKAVFLVLMLLLMLTAVLGVVSVKNITTTQEEMDLGQAVPTAAFAKEEDVHIRDQNLIYTQQINDEIVTMYLTVYTGNTAENTNHTWEEINTYSAYDYEEMGTERYQVAGLLQVGDENGPLPEEFGYGYMSPNCTVQIRGQSSSRNVQKNYKISIKENKGNWRGQTTIALNKHQGDGLRFRNKLGFDLLAGIDELLSLRTTFVHLYVRDLTISQDAGFVDYGIYTQVEQLNKTALERHGLDKRGHLYKINVCEFYRYEDAIKLKDDPAYDPVAFEEILEIKGDDDHAKLITLLEKVNDYSISIEDILEEHFDIENMAYWMAFNILVGNIDTQSRNFYLYSPLNSERWYILAWDLDGMLKRAEHTITNRLDYSEWERGVSNYWGNVLFQRCLKSKVFRAELDNAVEDIYQYLTQPRMQEMVTAYAELLKPYIYNGPDSTYAPLTASAYDVVTQEIVSEVETNYVLYQESFEKPMPFFIGVPQRQDRGYSVNWDASYDFGRESITYTFELSDSYLFENVIYRLEDTVIPYAEFGELPAGQYFMRVRAENESGESQYAFDYYAVSNGKIYGTKSFWVTEDGSIVEDGYVE